MVYIVGTLEAKIDTRDRTQLLCDSNVVLFDNERRDLEEKYSNLMSVYTSSKPLSPERCKIRKEIDMIAKKLGYPQKKVRADLISLNHNAN